MSRTLPVAVILSSRRYLANKREYVQALRCVETFAMQYIHGVIMQALDLGAIGYDALTLRDACPSVLTTFNEG